MSGTAYIGKIRELWRIPKFEGHVRQRHKCQRPGRRHSKDMKEETKQEEMAHWDSLAATEEGGG